MNKDNIENSLNNLVEVMINYHILNDLITYCNSNKRRNEPYIAKCIEKPTDSHLKTMKKNNLSTLQFVFYLILSVVLSFIFTIVVYCVTAIITIGTVQMSGDTMNKVLFTLCFIGICFVSWWYISDRNALKKAKNKYESEYTTYEKNVENELKTQKLENAKIFIIREELSKLEKQFQQTESLLQDLYRKNFIKYEYRRLECIITFYEYFKHGKCKTLDEAYSKYLEDGQLGKVSLYKGESISEMLSFARKTQVYFITKLKYAYEVEKKLKDSIDELAENFIENDYINELCSSSQLLNYNLDEYARELCKTSPISNYCMEQTFYNDLLIEEI